MIFFIRVVVCFIFFVCTAAHASPVVLITGVSQGIGYAIADLLASTGYTVYGSVRKTSSLENVLQLQEKYLDRFHLVTIEVTDQNSIDAAVCAIYHQEGRLDVLVNNAGAELYGSVENVTIKEAQKLFDVNFFGVMRMLQATLPIMRSQRSGRIIQISSRSGFRPLPSLSVYAATKFALEGLSETMAAILKPWNIDVSLIEPGPVLTNLDVNAPYGTHLPRDQDPYYPIFLKAGLLDVNNPWIQEPEEIALIVKQAIEAEKPLFRYQTTEKITQQASLRFRDTTGVSSVEEWKDILYIDGIKSIE